MTSSLPRPSVNSPAERSRRASLQARVVSLLLLSTAVAGAGALLLFRLHFQPPTVPAYELAEAATGEREVMRGGAFVMDLRPTGPVLGAVAARAFLVHDDVVRPWIVPFTAQRDGSVEIAGGVDSLFSGVPAGSWEIAVAVGRPENLPTDPREILRARTGDGGGAAAWHLVRERIRWGG